ncbi:MAG: PilZ domain-containing protein [Bdellovibrio sp.]|nr:PilZ domain-containing protein [Bdellovibrio sp.]
MSDLSFFNKLGPSSTGEILEFLVHNGTNLVLKIDDKHFKTKMLSKKNDREFSVYKFNFVEYQNKEIICSFDVKDEKYFFTASVRATNAELLITIPVEVYQLQRRNDFRVSIPPGISYVCEIRTVNFQKLNVKAELRDLSLGGCLVSLRNADKLEIPKDSEIELTLKINEFDNPSILTIAKHVHLIGSNNTLQLGLKYKDPEADFLSELQTTLVQLDRILRGKTL